MTPGRQPALEEKLCFIIYQQFFFLTTNQNGSDFGKKNGCHVDLSTLATNELTHQIFTLKETHKLECTWNSVKCLMNACWKFQHWELRPYYSTMVQLLTVYEDGQRERSWGNCCEIIDVPVMLTINWYVLHGFRCLPELAWCGINILDNTVWCSLRYLIFLIYTCVFSLSLTKQLARTDFP